MDLVYMSEPLQKALPWLTYEGEGSVLFYLPGEANTLSTVQRKAALFDWALRENYRILHVEPLWFKVHVFLFPDAASLAEAMEWDEPMEGGAAQIHSITLTDHPVPEELHCLAVHELAHVLTLNLFGWDLPGFLTEGLAVYAQNAVPETAFVNLGVGWDALAISMEEPLGALMETPEFNYGHAGAYIGYLVTPDTDNLDKLKALCRVIENLHWLPHSTRFARAIRAVYDVALEELEAAGRQTESERKQEPLPSKAREDSWTQNGTFSSRNTNCLLMPRSAREWRRKSTPTGQTRC